MRHRIKRVALLALTALMAGALFAGAAEAKKKKPKPVSVNVMTRNIFLGADLGPGLNANSFHDFIEGNGEILREVDLTNFPARAQGLAQEITEKKPDFIGLQEVALWRTGAPYPGYAQSSDPSATFQATTVKYDFLALLQAELQARGMNYTVAVEKPEFDFEAPTDYNDVDDDAPASMGGGNAANDEGPNSFDDAEITGRLTMRDVILVRDKKGVKFKNPISGSYQNLYTPNISGIDVPVTRGWTAVDATVTKGKGKKKRKAKFDFVNTHFEAFDDETQTPSIRALQAQELTSGGGTYAEGPASGKKVVLVGDFNSNVPGVQPGDQQAFQTLLDAGFSRRSTQVPASCCVPSVLTGPATEFDHVVDHVLSNSRKVKQVKSSVTGLTPANGYFNSDHAGVFSKLKIKK